MGNDKCEYQGENVCQQIDVHAICNRDENQCSCQRLYYSDGQTCGKYIYILVSLWLLIIELFL